MRRLGIAIVVVALSVAGSAQATVDFGPRTPVAVTPGRGVATTPFTVRFTTPLATGSSGGMRSWETASVADRNHGRRSCTSATARQLPPALADHQVSVTLRAAASDWCAGTYTGRITLYREIVCNSGPPSQRVACPEIAFAPQLIGRFRFTVAAS